MGFRSLFDIDRDLSEIAFALEASGGDITEVEERLDAWLADLDREATAKADAYNLVYKELKARHKARKAEADAMAALARADQNAAKRLSDRLKEFMEKHNISRFDGKRPIAICNNGGLDPIEVDDDLDLDKLPEEFLDLVRVEVSLDRDRIRDALNQGREIPFARFGQRGTHLRFR